MALQVNSITYLRNKSYWFSKTCSRNQKQREQCYANAKSLQSCPTLCDPIDRSPPGSAITGILQARILEWVAISFSNEWKRKVKVKSLSRVRLLATPWTAAHQAPLSMGFSRQEYWSGVPMPSPVCNTGDPSSVPGLERSTAEEIGYQLQYSWASLVAQLVKRIPWTAWSLGSQKIGYDWVTFTV